MCRNDVSPAAAPLLGQLLADLTEAIARRAGCDPADVRVGPVDFGAATTESEDA